MSGDEPIRGPWALAIHGGAGNIDPKLISQAQAKAYRSSLQRVTSLGAAVLEGGGLALEAVEAAVCELEDDPLFNAGRGAVFTADGRNELDAAIMDGRTEAAGAVAGVTRTRHPISLARAVMRQSDHVMLSGAGADAFALSEGLEAAGPAFFFSETRWKSLEALLDGERRTVPQRPVVASEPDPVSALVHDEGKHGTVGVVALDRDGHVAAGTSTGGITGKRWGRIGDSPLIGAGCYASDRSCAVSCTGAGEYFIRLVAAHRVAARVKFGKQALQDAVDAVIHGDLAQLGGDGGVIAVAPGGQVAWSFNTAGMYRARAREGGPIVVRLFRGEA